MTRGKPRKYPGAITAQIAWDSWRRVKSTRVSKQGAALSRVAGIGERLRNAKVASEPDMRVMPLPRESDTYRSNRPPSAPLRGVHPSRLPPAAVDRSQYLPHQGARECARRVRQGLCAP